ncbi:MAG: PEP-CTERM sorting domain-containing protein [Candidatus Hydrogenedentes bacterium]|nr:PEP-CTERM sorting domain-containing protein [Candidatus Hydrogenedentota bacterium]
MTRRSSQSICLTLCVGVGLCFWAGIARAELIADGLLITEITGDWELAGHIWPDEHGGWGGTTVSIDPGDHYAWDLEAPWDAPAGTHVWSSILTPHGYAEAWADNPDLLASTNPELATDASAYLNLDDSAVAGHAIGWVETVEYSPTESGSVTFSAALDYRLDLLDAITTTDSYLIAWVGFWELVPSSDPHDPGINANLLLDPKDNWERGNVSPGWYYEDQLVRVISASPGDYVTNLETISWTFDVTAGRVYMAASGIYVTSTNEYIDEFLSEHVRPVPEPTSLTLVLIGGTLMAIRRCAT